MGERKENLKRRAEQFQDIYGAVEKKPMLLTSDRNSLMADNEEPSTREEIAKIIQWFKINKSP